MFAEIWSNCCITNLLKNLPLQTLKALSGENVQNNVTKYLLNNGGKMLAGKSTKFLVFSIWKFDGLMIYIELFGDDCGYKILN